MLFRLNELNTELEYEVYLCRHAGMMAALVRFITGSDWDHIVLKNNHGFLDFNYPNGHTWYSAYDLEKVPWVMESYVCTIKTTRHGLLGLYHAGFPQYSLLFNLNYILYRFFKKAPFSGWNCVKFVRRVLNRAEVEPQHLDYCSPHQYALHLKYPVDKCTGK